MRSTLAFLVLLYAQPAWATFPSVVGGAATFDTDVVSDTNHTFDLRPSMTTGNLAMIFWAGTATDASPNFACPGWTTLEDEIINFGVGHLGIAYRVVDGSEGATITCTTDLAEVGQSIAIEITGQHATTTPEDGGGVHNTGTAPDPESLNPINWDVEDTLWIAASYAGGAGPDYTAYPTGFTLNQFNGTQTGSGDTAVVTKNDASASVDPSAFTVDSSSHWAAVTIAIRPAVASSGGGAPRMQLLGVQ